MSRLPIPLALGAIVVLHAAAAAGSDANATRPLGRVGVEESRTLFYDLSDAQVRTFDGDAARKAAGTTSADPYKSLTMLPSVNTESHDAYAQTADQSTIRVRGQVGDTFSRISSTVDGVPLGINVGNAATGYVVDMENLSGMSFATGILPSDSGLGLGTTAGALDLRVRRPDEQPGVNLATGVGGDAYHKLFFRADSGEVAPGTALFVSASSGSNDKWRGMGDITRENLSAMVRTRVSDALRVELFGAYNRFERYEYKPLEYDETLDLDRYYESDYATQITGDKFADASYYEFYRQQFDEYAASLALYATLGEVQLSLKPYLFGNDGERYLGDPSTGTVKRIEQTQEAWGATLQAEYPLAGGTLYGGWWYQRADSTPPPNLMKIYNINADGSLSFKSIGMLTKNDDRVSSAPYVGYRGTFGATTLRAGLRYLMFDFPAVTGYVTSGIGDVDYDAALAASSGVKTGMEVDANPEKLWLPSLFVEQNLGAGYHVGGGYGRNYANPWQGPLWSVYNSKSSVFSAAGITLQDLWDELRLETSDNVELFVRYGGSDLNLKTTLFYGDYAHKQVTVYDPALNLSYYKSDASSTSMGAEIEALYRVMPELDLFASAYYNRFEFDDDILLATDTYLQAEGNQVPDVARVGAKLGVSYRLGRWGFTPTLRYVGSRYGDAENREKVDPYTVVDMNVDCAIAPGVRAALAITNLFDNRYVGVINNGLDDTRTGATSYYQGAPFSAVATLNVRY